MNSLNSARVKLTLWYLTIITVVSIAFSAVIYNGVTLDIEQTFRAAEYKLRGDLLLPRRTGTNLILLSENFEQAKRAVFIRLAILNTMIISLSGAAAYFLAGKSLQPVEKAMVEQKRFVSDASHELRTPLTALRTELEVTLRDTKLTKNNARKQIASSLEEVIKMQNLTNYLLLLNRYENGEMKLEMTNLNLKNIVESVITKHKIFADEKNIKLSTELKTSTIKANRTGVEELVSILLDNAIKYTPRGGAVNINVQRKGNKAILKIEDTGIGIKQTDIPYIFNRFYRADNSRSHIGTNGYGLGLAIAKSITNLHGARITASSTINKGSVFTVTFCA